MREFKKFISNYLGRFISSGLYLKKNIIKKEFRLSITSFLKIRRNNENQYERYNNNRKKKGRRGED